MKTANFEKSIQELETIVKQLEGGELSLDEMLTLFEKGIGLSKNCTKMLEEAEKKVNILVKGKDGQVEKQSFEVDG